MAPAEGGPPGWTPPGSGGVPPPGTAPSSPWGSPAPGYPYASHGPPRDPTAVIGRRIGAFFIDVAISIVAFIIIFVPLATQRTVDETLQLPGCHPASADSNRVSCDNRAVFQLGDTVYEANSGPTFGLDAL